MERGQRVRDGARIGAKFRAQNECISSSKLRSRGRDEWPDEKDEQGYKLQDEKVQTKRKETKVKDRKGGC